MRTCVHALHIVDVTEMTILVKCCLDPQLQSDHPPRSHLNTIRSRPPPASSPLHVESIRLSTTYRDYWRGDYWLECSSIDGSSQVLACSLFATSLRGALAPPQPCMQLHSTAIHLQVAVASPVWRSLCTSAITPMHPESKPRHFCATSRRLLT